MRQRAVAILCLILTLLSAGASVAQQAPAKNASPPANGQNSATPAVPDAATLLALIRTALIALDQANRTGNYTVLRDIGSPAFQAANSAAQLAVSFTKLRDAKLDLTPIAVVTPKATEPPAITNQGMLRIVGAFPTKPIQINFQLLFQLVEGKWRVYALSVGAQSAAAAPAAAAPATAAPKASNTPKPAAPKKKK
jgi:hypothetical protein